MGRNAEILKISLLNIFFCSTKQKQTFEVNLSQSTIRNTGQEMKTKNDKCQLQKLLFIAI